MNNVKNLKAARALTMGVVAALVIVGMAGTGAAVSGLVGEWHFDGNAQDSSGNGNHGTISGATFVTGISGQALSFDGVNDYVTSGNGSSLNFGAGYFSLSAWIKTTAMGNADNEVVIYFSGSNGYYYFGIHPGNPNPNGASFIINDGSTQDASYGTTNLFDGKWHNIVFTRDATSLKVFTDGIQEGSQPSRGLNVGTGTTTISNKEGSWFNGIIDEVRIYNRALTASEIQANYNALTATPTPTPTTPTPTPTPTTPTPTTPAPTTPTPTTPAPTSTPTPTPIITQPPISTPTPTQTSLTDTLPPSISFSKQTVDLNKNGQLDEGEKLVITYGANDENGVKSIKVLLDGNLIELRNNEGTYSVTTDSLSVGSHSIVVEATDSKGNRNSEELKINAARAGPSVYFQKSRYEVMEGEEVNIVLSAVNPIGNPKMEALLIIKPPGNGVSITESWCKGLEGMCTGKYEIEAGDSVRSNSVNMRAERAGEYPIDAEIYYQYEGGQRSPTRYETLTLVVKPKQAPIGAQSMPKTPGFEVILAGIGMIVALALRRR